MSDITDAAAGNPPPAQNQPAAEITPEQEVDAFATFETHDGQIVKPKAKAKETDQGEPDGSAADEADTGDVTKADGTEDGEQKPKPKPSVQDRINELTKQRRESERRAQQLERELAQLKSGQPPAQGQQQQQQQQADDDPAPDPTKFEYGELDPRYMDARAAHTARQEFKRLQKEADARRQQDQQDSEARAFQAKAQQLLVKGSEKYDDFEEAVNDPTLPLTPQVAFLVVESEHQVELAYHLAKNPEELRKIAKMPPHKQAIAIGRLEARFEKPAGEQQKPRAPAAPPPVDRARGAGGQFVPRADTADFAAFEAMAMGQK